ncbi:TetR/AcrR family transcriptional regulator [Oerskovia paurometabola]|uniref:TetR/AcrR family transcriptional regulator n=1 Tax=Oerskovia paurometabola TaxID=162170 RepID=UPI0034183535
MESATSSERAPSVEAGEPTRRMSRDERREQILDAATAVFAAGGYAGTSTDQVARAAGVSQPYVVRMFGTKHELFAEVFDRIGRRIVGAFSAVPRGPEAAAELGSAYVRLLADRNLLLVLMHGFAAGADPVFGARSREIFVQIFEIYQDRTGGTLEQARDFLAQGMLLNTLLAIGAPEHFGDDPRLAALMLCAFGDALPAVDPAAQVAPDRGRAAPRPESSRR